MAVWSRKKKRRGKHKASAQTVCLADRFIADDLARSVTRPLAPCQDPADCHSGRFVLIIIFDMMAADVLPRDGFIGLLRESNRVKINSNQASQMSGARRNYGSRIRGVAESGKKGKARSWPVG